MSKKQPVAENTAVLPVNPKAALVSVFNDVAVVVGTDKAAKLLESLGVTAPEQLRASDLYDAIDALYEVA